MILNKYCFITLTCLFFLFLLTVSISHAAPAEIWRTGQTTSYHLNDDGGIQAGVAWPIPRFTDNGDGTITDNLTGLIWLKDITCFNKIAWNESFNVISDFNQNSSDYGCSDYTAVYSDWRLPNILELRSLIDYSQFEPVLPSDNPFLNVNNSGIYWSSTTDFFSDNTIIAWGLDMTDSRTRLGHINKAEALFFVWPVRGGNVRSLENNVTTLTPDDELFKLQVYNTGRVASMIIPQTDYDDLQNEHFAELAVNDEIIEISANLYRYFNDDFDFIFLIFNNSEIPDDGFAFGRFCDMQNNTTGLGISLFDKTFDFFNKLTGIIALPYRSALCFGPSLHEIMHNWGNYIIETSSDVHWGFSSADGLLGGFDIDTLVDLGNGLYQAANGNGGSSGFKFGEVANGGNSLPYSEIELYLMGLVDNINVPPLSIAINPMWEDITNGIFRADGFTQHTIEDIIQEHGERSPLFANSQKNFKALTVIMSPRPLTITEWEEVDQEIQTFSFVGNDSSFIYNFWEATEGKATIVMDKLFNSIREPPLQSLPVLIPTPTPLIQILEADFSAQPTAGAVPLIVKFTDLSTGDIDSWQWNFGDGGFSNERNPSHEYLSEGFFTVTLSIQGINGFDSEIKTNFISTSSLPTTTIALLDPNSGSVTKGQTVTVNWQTTNASENDTVTVSMKRDFVLPTVTVVDGINWHKFTVSTKNSGSYLATIPDSVASAEDWRFYIKHNNSNIWDSSDNAITVLEAIVTPSPTPTPAQIPTVTLTFPNNGTFKIGDTGSISWTATETLSTDLMSVSMKRDSVAATVTTPDNINWHRFTTEAVNTGSFSAIIPDFIAPADDWRFYVKHNDSNIWDSSDNTITVLDAAVTPSPSLTSIPTPAPAITKIQIDSITPNSPVEVTIGKFVTLSVTFTNTGEIPWRFISEVTIQVSNESGVRGFSQMLTEPLKPGQQTTVLMSDYFVETEDDVWIQFNIWQDSNTLLASKPINPQKLIHGILPVISIAGFVANQSIGELPLLVQFTDKSTGDIDFWQWDFGDGGISFERNPSHEYLDAGNFDVSLTVSGLGGSDTMTRTITVLPISTPTPSPTPISSSEESFLKKYAPILIMHPDELFYPIDVKIMLQSSHLYEKKLLNDKFTDNISNPNDLITKYNDKKYYLKLASDNPVGFAKNSDLWRTNPTVYGRQFTSNGKTVLQYWFFYAFNNWDDDHEGDWEMIQIILGNSNQPEHITYSIHEGGKTFGWNDPLVSKDVDYPDHPAVYVTLGGHGSWNAPGDNIWYQVLGTCIKCTDKTSIGGNRLLPPSTDPLENTDFSYILEELPTSNSQSTDHWIFWKGFWGNQFAFINIRPSSKAILRVSGPPSPPHIDYIENGKAGRWDDPLSWTNNPNPSGYNICSSNNSRIVAHDLNGNIVHAQVSCVPTTEFKVCIDDNIICPTIKTITSNKDLIFDIYSLDGKNVDLLISRYITTEQRYNLEFKGLTIPKKGIAKLLFSPQKNSSFKIDIDYDLDGIFETYYLPDLIEP